MKDALPAALPGPPLVGNLAESAGDPLSFFGRLKRERGDVDYPEAQGQRAGLPGTVGLRVNR